MNTLTDITLTTDIHVEFNNLNTPDWTATLRWHTLDFSGTTVIIFLN